MLLNEKMREFVRYRKSLTSAFFCVFVVMPPRIRMESVNTIPSKSSIFRRSTSMRFNAGNLNNRNRAAKRAHLPMNCGGPRLRTASNVCEVRRGSGRLDDHQLMRKHHILLQL